MESGFQLICIGLLVFLGNELLAQGMVGALSKVLDISPKTQGRTGCRTDWLRHRNQCYHINRAARLSRKDAQIACKAKSKDAYLAEMVDKAAVDFLLKQVQEGGEDSLWVSNIPGVDGCPSLDTSGPAPDSQGCTDTKGYICQELDKLAGCPEGFVGFGDWCYISRPSRSTWGVARVICSTIYPAGDLAAITSKGEHDFVRNEFGVASGDKQLWIGLYKPDYDSSYQWTNGEKVGYLPLDQKYIEGGTSGYATMRLTTSEFLMKEDPGEEHEYLCSVPRATDTTDLRQSHVDDTKFSRSAPAQLLKCETKWKEFGDGCFRPFERKMSYVKASSFCEERGAHLISVHSVRENDLIKTEIRKRKPTGSYWIGLTTDKNGTHWSDRTPYDYTNVTPRSKKMSLQSGEMARKTQSCFGMNSVTGKWTQLKCWSQRFVLCLKGLLKDKRDTGKTKSGTATTQDSPESTKSKEDETTRRQNSALTQTTVRSVQTFAAGLAGLVLMLAIVLGVIAWRRRVGNSHSAWLRLQNDIRPCVFDNHSSQMEAVCSETQDMGRNQSVVYGTLVGIDRV